MHREGQAVLERLKAIAAIYDEQHAQLQELLDIETLFLQPLTLMADAGFIQRQDVNNAFHIAAITTLQHVLKALLEQERNDWPRTRFARVFATKAHLMQQLYCTYASDTNVMLQSLRRLISNPIISQFFAEVAAENPKLFTALQPGLDSAGVCVCVCARACACVCALMFAWLHLTPQLSRLLQPRSPNPKTSRAASQPRFTHTCSSESMLASRAARSFPA